jgi:uncharacterized protein YuzE
MTPNFANPSPEDYSYDPQGDALYITFSHEKAARTVALLADWPLLLVDVNDKDQIVGVECVGVKQFGVDTFVRLLQERLRSFGVQLADKEAESLISFMRLPGAELALARS